MVGGDGGGIGLHRAELDQHKRLLLTSRSRLKEQRGTGIKPADHLQQQQLARFQSTDELVV